MKYSLFLFLLFSNISAQNTIQTITGEQIHDYVSYKVVVISDKDYGHSGSGVIIDSRGYILTNYHVVDGLENIRCHLYFNNEDKHMFNELSAEDAYEVEIISTDEIRDLALLKLIDAPKDLNPISFAPPSSTKIGGTVYAMGHPFNGWNTYLWYFTSGSVNKIGFEPVYSESWIDELLWIFFDIDQEIIGNVKHVYTQTPINGGNSGGPLIDNYGNLVGINSWGFDDLMNISGSIHIDEINAFIDEADIKIDNYSIENLYDESGEKIIGFKYLVLSYGNLVSIEQINSLDNPDKVEYYLIDLNMDNMGEIVAFDKREDASFSYWEINFDSDEYIDWSGEIENAPDEYSDIINQGFEIFDSWDEELNRFE